MGMIWFFLILHMMSLSSISTGVLLIGAVEIVIKSAIS